MSQENSKNVMVQGRIVWVVGDLFKGDVATIYGTKTPKLNKLGQGFREYGFGLAVPKSVLTADKLGPGQPGEIWSALHEVAMTLFPSRQIPTGFHMKYKDGDTGTNQDGTALNTKEGYPGHIVLSCKTSAAAPKFYKWENGQNVLINEGIKCGDYVNVQLNIKAHGGTNAGLYLNPNAVQFLGFGKEIVNAPSADSIFGNAQPAVPVGASATPFAPPGMLVAPPQHQGFPPPQMTAAAQPQGFAPPQTAAAPHWGVLPPQHQPQQQPTPPGMPPLPGFPQQ